MLRTPKSVAVVCGLLITTQFQGCRHSGTCTAETTFGNKFEVEFKNGDIKASNLKCRESTTERLLNDGKNDLEKKVTRKIKSCPDFDAFVLPEIDSRCPSISSAANSVPDDQEDDGGPDTSSNGKDDSADDKKEDTSAADDKINEGSSKSMSILNYDDFCKNIEPLPAFAKAIPTQASVEDFYSIQGTYLEKFRSAMANKDFTPIHNPVGHFDWWMFPIDKPASYKQYCVGDQNMVSKLKNYQDWRTRYLESVKIYSFALGWDIDNRKRVKNSQYILQGWQDWDIRLAKMVRSLWLFEENDYFLSLQEFAKDVRKVEKQGKPFYYRHDEDEMLCLKPRN